MARLVEKTAQKPQEVEGKMICMCGLSKDQPFCDGSHLNTQDEEDGKLYWYDKNGEKEEVGMMEDKCCGGCGSCDDEKSGCCIDKK